MKPTLIFYILFFTLSANGSLMATQWVKSYALSAYAGPEIYDVQRTKEGGTKQSGVLYGVRGGYEHICRYKLYWGIEGLWAKGVLEGKNQDIRLKSELTDANIEARIGYTFQCKSWRCASLTPYFGGGYFWEMNNYMHPSPLHVHFTNTFSYIPVGFLSQIYITPHWSIGLNFKARFLVESEVRVSHDPDHENQTQNYEDEVQYRVELPITYFLCWKQHSLAVNIVPFYEYRPYGHRANFPFDFLETKLNLYGVTLKFLYLF